MKKRFPSDPLPPLTHWEVDSLPPGPWEPKKVTDEPYTLKTLTGPIRLKTVAPQKPPRQRRRKRPEEEVPPEVRRIIEAYRRRQQAEAEQKGGND